MKKLMCLLALTLAGCGDTGGGTTVLPLSPGGNGRPSAPVAVGPVARVQGVLGRSRSGALAVLDAPLPAGWSPVPQAGIRLFQSSAVTTTAFDGSFQLPATEGRQRLLVTTSDTQVVLEAPAFTLQPDAPVGLALFPNRFQLRDSDIAGARVVQMDAQGRFAPLLPESVTWQVLESPPPHRIPITSELAIGVADQPGDNPGDLTPGPDRVIGPLVGESVVVADQEGLSQSADALGQSPACLAALQGQVTVAGQPVAGALVQVEGFPESRTTDAQGRYQFEGLAAVPSQVHAYLGAREIAEGFAPLANRLATRLDMPARPRVYQSGPRIALPDATGLAAKPSRQLLVTAGGQIHLYTVDGQETTAPPSGGLGAASGVASDFSGQAYVADSGGNRIVLLPGVSIAADHPGQVAADGGACLYALADGQDAIQFLANTGVSTWAAPQALGAELLSHPAGLAVARDGRVYVADRGHNRVAVLEVTEGPSGRLLRGDPTLPATSLGVRLVDQWSVPDPRGLALGPEGAVYVATPYGVGCFTSQGYDAIPVSTAPARGPISVDRDGRVWVSESDGIRQYLPATPAVRTPNPAAPTGDSLVQNANFQALETSIQATLSSFEIPGASLAISVNGRLVVERGYGMARQDLEAQTPVTPAMLFRLASCSKAVTGVASLLQLQDYPGLLGLQTHPFANGGLLGGAVPELNLRTEGVADARLNEVEVAHLLRMTAGLDSPGPLYAPLARTLGGSHPPATAVETLRYIFSHLSLSRSPGTRYVYSDVAYYALGRLIEAVAVDRGLSATTYEAYCLERLLTKIGITDMRVSNTRLGGEAPHEVSYYPYSGQPGVQSVFTNAPAQVPQPYGELDGRSHDSAGGWIASARDLIRLTNAVAPDKTPPGFTNPLDATRREWMKVLPQVEGDSPKSYFGIGFLFSQDENGVVQKMEKDGSLPGTSSYVKYLRQGEDQVVYVYLLNSRPGPGPKRQFDADLQLRGAIEKLLQQQAGNWPAGDLF